MRQVLPDCMMGPSEPCAGFSFEQARLGAEIDRLRAALAEARKVIEKTVHALDEAECVIDADGCIESFQRVQLARKSTYAFLDRTKTGNDPTSWTGHDYVGK